MKYLLAGVALVALFSALSFAEYCDSNATCHYPYLCEHNQCEYHVYACTTDAQCSDNYKCIDKSCTYVSNPICPSWYGLVLLVGAAGLLKRG